MRDADPIKARYIELCMMFTDIGDHLPTLRKYGDQCEHVTEMGVRDCVSLHAWLVSKASKVVAYDKNEIPQLPACEKLTFHKADVLEVEIEPTDLLFLDTWHTYDQLKAELNLHGNKARKYILIHDTELRGEVGEDGKSPALNQAIDEFIGENSDWSLWERYRNCYGLTILNRHPFLGCGAPGWTATKPGADPD